MYKKLFFPHLTQKKSNRITQHITQNANIQKQHTERKYFEQDIRTVLEDLEQMQLLVQGSIYNVSSRLAQLFFLNVKSSFSGQQIL